MRNAPSLLRIACNFKEINSLWFSVVSVYDCYIQGTVCFFGAVSGIHQQEALLSILFIDFPGRSVWHQGKQNTSPSRDPSLYFLWLSQSDCATTFLTLKNYINKS